MIKKIKDLAFQGDISAIAAVLDSINESIWESHSRELITDVANPEEIILSDREYSSSPREFTPEELSTIEQLSNLLNSRLDSLEDKDLLLIIQTPIINTVPFVKRLAEHNNPTGLFYYSWMLQGGYESQGVEPNSAEADIYLDRAVNSALEIADGFSVDNLQEEIEVFDYHIKGDTKYLDTIEKIITRLCRKKGLSGNLADSCNMEIPIGPIMYMLAGGDCGGLYKGIIKRCTKQDGTLILNTACVGISAGAFKGAFEIFFGQDVEIEMKKA